MTTRTKFQLGLIAVAAAVGALTSACAGLPPIGRTEYCYWYTSPTTPSNTAPPTTALVCHDRPLEDYPTPTTTYGYVAPVPAGTRIVK